MLLLCLLHKHIKSNESTNILPSPAPTPIPAFVGPDKPVSEFCSEDDCEEVAEVVVEKEDVDEATIGEVVREGTGIEEVIKAGVGEAFREVMGKTMLGRMPMEEMLVDKVIIGEVSVGEVFVDEVSVDRVAVLEADVDRFSLENVFVDVVSVVGAVVVMLGIMVVLGAERPISHPKIAIAPTDELWLRVVISITQNSLFPGPEDEAYGMVIPDDTLDRQSPLSLPLGIVSDKKYSLVSRISHGTHAGY
ncbi:hypothetical protein BBP40_000931 [Aspergillus hancockii]|nr:hypothetical protein BBP40_000931 [Aspergillus hancockii]